MNNFKLNIIGLVAVSAILSSCHFLDEYSQNEFKPSSVADYDAILTHEAYTPTSTISPLSYIDVLSDDVAAFDYCLTNDGDIMDSDITAVQNCEPFYTWSSTMFDTSTENALYNATESWEVLYELIMPCNVILYYIDDATGDEGYGKWVKAQALTLRALYYYYLVNLFGDPYYDNPEKAEGGVPIVTSFQVTSSYPTRNTVKEVYDLMISDLTEAIELFAAYDSPYTTWRRMSSEAAHGILSRIYLQMWEYDLVEYHCRKVLETKSELGDLQSFTSYYTTYYGYSFGSSYCEPYNFYGDMKEVIFTIFKGGSGDGIKKFFPDRSPVSSSFYPRNTAYQASYELMDLYDTEVNTTAQGVATVAVSGDLRYLAYYNHMQTRTSDDGSSYVHSAQFGCKATSSTSVDHTGMRTAEIYLNLAEALIRNGETAEAFEYINLLRKNRWVGEGYTLTPTGDIETDLATCLEERRRELSFEHLRWFDLRRLGRPELTHAVPYSGDLVYTLEENDPRYTLPIPTDALYANPSLVQNTY